MSGARAAFLTDGRLHLQHGPIDLICQVWGGDAAIRTSYAAAMARFWTVLDELVSELPLLRSEHGEPQGIVARRMASAVAPFRPAFITPMAAVAGAVAEEVLAALVGPGVRKAYVNNGGDIAVHLGPGESLVCALAQAGEGRVKLDGSAPSRGVATSGWRGRSWSFGIADSVTVLARTASMADAAATMIANAVDLPGHPAITRSPACDLQADSDLGPRRVTTAVGPLTQADAREAVARGLATAEVFRARGLIETAAVFLQAEARVAGPLALIDRENVHV